MPMNLSGAQWATMSAMNSRAPSRRPGYAPTDSAVGRRGLDTRDRILQSAATLFIEAGFDAASTDAIARAAGTSRASVYQYFASKQQIFEEFLRACEDAVSEHAARLRGLGPDSDGVSALADWLRGWEQLYDDHLVVMAEFPGIGTTESILEDRTFIANYITDIAARIERSGVVGLDPLTAAISMLRIIHAANLFRMRGVDIPHPTNFHPEGLALAMQYLLFPQTPPAAVAGLTGPPRRAARVRRRGTTPLDSPAPTRADPLERSILDAASQLFAERGYHAVAVEDLYRAADISRASFYRFFRGKSEVLHTLTLVTAGEFIELIQQLQAIADLVDERPLTELREWLRTYTRFHRNHRGIIRAWFDPTVRTQVDAVIAPANATLWNAIADLIDKGLRPAATSHPTTAIVTFLSVIVRMTEPISTTLGDPYPADLDPTADLMTTLLDRALLGWSEPTDAGHR